MRAHGTSFFNVTEDDGCIFFLDNLVHQCGHIIFNTITFEKEKLFTVPVDTPLSRYTKNDADFQDIYGRFHGLFTQTNINKTFDKCIELRYFKNMEWQELIGRFCSNMKRFAVALHQLNHPEMYTSAGERWFQYFQKTHDEIFERRKDLIQRFAVHDQPYVFDFRIFQKTNKEKMEELENWDSKQITFC
jgi:hypothetical protein